MKHIVCYSGGHSSALVAVEVCRRYGKDNTILINHECLLEEEDVTRFEQEVAAYLGIPITYASMPDADTLDQFDVVVKKGSFINPHGRQALCTTVMKTEPFMEWLGQNFPNGEDCIIYYGFDKSEGHRIQRRSTIMAAQGYRTDYPLAFWAERTVWNTEKDLGIKKPNSYSTYKHANCKGCLKAGRQHWYCVYVNNPEIYAKGEQTEEIIGYTIIDGASLSELRPLFEKMQTAGVPATEHIQQAKFWAMVRKRLKSADLPDLFTEDAKPCECFV